jgi:hypothetical protein
MAYPDFPAFREEMRPRQVVWVDSTDRVAVVTTTGTMGPVAQDGFPMAKTLAVAVTKYREEEPYPALQEVSISAEDKGFTTVVALAGVVASTMVVVVAEATQVAEEVLITTTSPEEGEAHSMAAQTKSINLAFERGMAEWSSHGEASNSYPTKLNFSL